MSKSKKYDFWTILGEIGFVQYYRGDPVCMRFEARKRNKKALI